MPFSALIRLARRIFRAPATQPISKPAFKPTLEALDLRAMPALFTWTDATGDNQYSDPYNWGDTAGVLSIPGPGDDILFPNFAGANGPGGQSGGATGAGGPSGGSADCYGMQSNSGGPFNSITLTAGYTGTVTVTGPVQTDALYLNNGTIDQPAGSGSDMTVLGGATTNDYTWWLNPGWNGGSDFYWTGGTLNSTSNLANINISGSSTIATIAPGNAGTLTTGDNVNLNNGAVATLSAGTLTLANGASLTLNGNSSFVVDPGEENTATLNEFGAAAPPPIVVTTTNSVTIKSGQNNTIGPVAVSGGTFTLQSQASVVIVGQLQNGPTFWQSSGKTILGAGSNLGLQQDDSGNMVVSGGTLMRQTASDGDSSLPTSADIGGNLTVTGGDIYVETPGASGVAIANNGFGTLYVLGNVTWTGGTYHPIVMGVAQDGMVGNATAPSDKWSATKTFTIGIFVTIDPIVLDSDYGYTGAPYGDGIWLVLRGGGGIIGNPNAVGLDAPWSITTGGVAPVTLWYLNYQA
jgi:hypothetical protein